MTISTFNKTIYIISILKAGLHILLQILHDVWALFL